MDEQARATLIEELRELARIPSRSGPDGGEEGARQALIARRLGGLGARVRTFEVDEVPGARSHPLFHGPDRDYAGRPTVLAELGPKQGPALVVLAHSDTVPVNRPEQWTHDPFGAELKDGVLYGLGISDDTWGCASVLSLARHFARRREALRKRLLLATTIDEEHGVGNGLLLLMLAGVQAEAAIYLDGTGLQPRIGNCGGSNLNLRPRGGMPERQWASDEAALREAAARLSRERAPLFDRPYFRDNSQVRESVRVARRRDARGERLLLAFYTLPGENRTAVCEALEAAVAEALGERRGLYELHYREPWFEPALADPATPFFGLFAEAYANVLGREAVFSTVSKQDAFIFQNHAGIPTLSFGVSRSSGPGAVHAPDERLTVEDAWNGFRIACEAVQRWLEEPGR